MKRLNDETFAELFGTTKNNVKQFVGSRIDSIDLNFKVMEGRERDELILSVLKKINSPELKNAGGHREVDWEDGWRENLDEFVHSGYDTEKLVPKYYKSNVPIRLNREYIIPVQPDFTYKYTEIFREWLFKEYLAEYDAVYEFGCGTAHNLIHLAELYPEKHLFGFDWAKSSQEIILEVEKQNGLKIKGGKFDFFNPDESIIFEQSSVVFTFGALEQVGSKHEAYLDFILKRKPDLCIDVIGIHELYDQSDLLDYLALQYHKRRNYLHGYLTRLQELAAAKKIEIVKIHRQMFGNLFDDPYSIIVWKP